MSTVFISHPDCLDHITPENHPERVERLISIMESLSNLENSNLIRLDAPLCKEADIMLSLIHI